MKRAYNRKDKSPDDKSVEFVNSSGETLKGCYEKRVCSIQKRIDDIEEVTLENAKNVKESILSLRRNVDNMASEFKKQQVIYNKNFELMEEDLKMSWSHRIRSFMGF